MFLILLALGLIAEGSMGQEKLRESWQSLQTQNWDRQTWMKEHGLVDVAEDYWTNPSASAPLSQDVYAAYDSATNRLRERPYLPQVWLPALLNYWKQINQRPFDATPLLLRTLDHWLMAIGLALSILILFYLLFWASPIAKDFSKLFKSVSALRVFLCLSFFLSLGIQILPFWLIMGTMLLLGYLRSLSFAVLSTIFAVALSLYPNLRERLIHSASLASWHEAYEEGRTRIEYSQSTESELSSLFKAHWADRNKDLAATRYWLEKSEASLQKANLEFILLSREKSAFELIPDYQLLHARDPQNPILTFNLAQLQTKAQNLVEADRLRQSIDVRTFSALLQQSEKTSDLLLPLPPEESSKIFWNDFNAQLKNMFSIGAPSGRSGLIHLLGLAFVILFGLFMRQRASGLCSYTGEPTPRLHLTESPFYVSGKTQSIKGARQQVDSAMRNYKSEIEQLIRKWSWLIIDLRSVLTQGQLWTSFVWLTCIFGILLNSTSSSSFNILGQWIDIEPIYLMSRTPASIYGLIAVLAMIASAWLVTRQRGGS